MGLLQSLNSVVRVRKDYTRLLVGLSYTSYNFRNNFRRVSTCWLFFFDAIRKDEHSASDKCFVVSRLFRTHCSVDTAYLASNMKRLRSEQRKVQKLNKVQSFMQQTSIEPDKVRSTYYRRLFLPSSNVKFRPSSCKLSVSYRVCVYSDLGSLTLSRRRSLKRAHNAHEST